MTASPGADHILVASDWVGPALLVLSGVAVNLILCFLGHMCHGLDVSETRALYSLYFPAVQARLCYPQSIKGRYSRGIVDDKQKKAHPSKRRNEVKLRYHQP